MRIAFDLDGVLADLHGAFAETANRLYPELDSAAIESPEVGSSPPDAAAADRAAAGVTDLASERHAADLAPGGRRVA